MSDDNDIVTRLRACSSSVEPEARLRAWYWLPKVAHEAADEIERLRRKLLAEENAYNRMWLENKQLRNELVTVTNLLNLERDITSSKENTNG